MNQGLVTCTKATERLPHLLCAIKEGRIHLLESPWSPRPLLTAHLMEGRSSNGNQNILSPTMSLIVPAHSSLLISLWRKRADSVYLVITISLPRDANQNALLQRVKCRFPEVLVLGSGVECCDTMCFRWSWRNVPLAKQHAIRKTPLSKLRQPSSCYSNNVSFRPDSKTVYFLNNNVHHLDCSILVRYDFSRRWKML